MSETLAARFDALSREVAEHGTMDGLPTGCADNAALSRRLAYMAADVRDTFADPQRVIVPWNEREAECGSTP